MKQMNRDRCPSCHYMAGHAPHCPAIYSKHATQNIQETIRKQEVLDFLDWETPEWGRLDG